MANWAELIPDLLTLIAKKVELYEDFVAFRGVCRSWRSAAAKNNFRGVCRSWRSVAAKNNFCPLQQQVPWLLLAGDADDSRDFYSLINGGLVHSVYLPEAKGKRILSSLGWLITIDEEGEMELLHPLSRSRICLPSAFECTYFDIEPTMMQNRAISMLNRAALSARLSEDESYTLMTLICYKLAYRRPGNNAWITIQTPGVLLSEVVYFGGQFYAMDYQGRLLLVDINNKTANIVGRIPLPVMETDHCYLVDSGDGHMIAVFREIEVLYNDDYDVLLNYWTNSFELFKFDSSYNCHPINDLGQGRSLFIGQCAPVLVSVGSGSIIRRNCIYFTDDAMLFYFGDNFIAGGGGRDMGVYNLEQQEFIKDGAPIYQGNKGRSPLCPPLWVLPYD